MSGRASGRRLGLLAAAGALGALALSPLLAGTAAAASPAVAFITVGDVISDVTAPAGTPGSAIPSVLTSVDRSVSVHVEFFAADGSATSFGKDTGVALTTSGLNGATVVRTVGKDATFADLSTDAFTSAANKVTVTVSVPSSKGKAAITPVPSQTVFDVLEFFTPPITITQGVNDVQRVGKTGLGCGEVTEDNPLCATVILPQGSASQVVLGTGACDGTTYTKCSAARSFVLELLGDLGTKYTPTSPATVILSCDKKFCGKGSIQRNVPVFTQGGNTDLVGVPACSAKGVASPGPACVDYVQSTRDNAGDTHLWVLFTRDLRVSCC
jgi:hypothetical protein